MSTVHLLAFASFMQAIATVVICVCRLNAMHKDVMIRVRTEYACYVAGSFFVACGPYMGDWPGYPTLGMQSAIIIGLLCGAHAWRDDIPPDVATGPGDLRRADGSKT